MFEHYSVLLDETIDALNIKEDGIYVDCTLGGGGHSSRILEKLTTGHLYCFDQDAHAIEAARERLSQISDNFTIIHANFKEIKARLSMEGVYKVDGIVFDLGVSSPQFDNAERGFSYNTDARLDMRMNQEQDLDAEKVVNTYSEQELTRILKEYGEERYAYAIAKAIVKKRTIQPIKTTFELVDVIKSALPAKELRKKGHPAKQTFQAIRIEVNNELGALQKGIEEALDLLDVNGRCAIITFHSLEDRIVKNTFKDYSSAPFVEPRIPLKVEQMEQASFQLINRKPILATQEELDENHRSHSAKLRVIERIKG